MFLGIFVVAFSGNWVIENYELLSMYPKSVLTTFGVGWILVMLAYVMSKFSSYKEKPNAEIKDNRNLINRWEREGIPFAKWLIGLAVTSLVFTAFQSWYLAYELFWLYVFIGIVFVGFIYVMKGKRVEEEHVDLDFEGKTKKFLDLIDYRRHPFNLSLIVFTLVVLSFSLSKQLDIPLYMEVGGNPRYVTSLPTIAFLTSGLMVVSTYIYIINNGDIFGIRKAEQNGLKLMQIHFFEIGCCGVTFFLWLFIVIEALI